MLSRHSHNAPQPLMSPEVCGEFVKIKISSSYDKITGRLFLNYDTRRCTYDGIKIRLNSHLKPIVAERLTATCNEMDLFEHCPIETTLPGEFMFAEIISGHHISLNICNNFID